jgi:hypothetical protein
MLTLHHHDALSEDGSLANNPDRGGSARVADLRIFSAKAAWTGKACLKICKIGARTPVVASTATRNLDCNATVRP